MEESAGVVATYRSAHAWGPIVVNRPASAGRRLLKIVAFNARGGRFVDKIAARLRRPPLNYPDLIMLSEMDWRRTRSNRRETAAELAAELEMSFAYVGEFGIPSHHGIPVSFVGNALLSNRPLADVRALPMARTTTQRRLRRFSGAPAGLVARIMVNRRLITVGVVHLNSRGNPNSRELQMREYLDGLPTDGAAILGGDFNTTTVDLGPPASLIYAMALALIRPHRFRNPQRWEPLFQCLRDAGFDTAGANVIGTATFTLSRLIPATFRPRLDWLALRGLTPVPNSAAVVAAQTSRFSTRFSDHDFITCTVQA